MSTANYKQSQPNKTASKRKTNFAESDRNNCIQERLTNLAYASYQPKQSKQAAKTGGAFDFKEH